MKTLAIVQARMGSIRLKNKVMLPVKGVPLIETLLARLNRSKLIDKIIVATSIDPSNNSLVDFVNKCGFEVFRGPEEDVLERYYMAAKLYSPERVVRITGDCPLIDPELVDEVLRLHSKQEQDYSTNTLPPTYPDGLDIEVFNFHVLEKTYHDAKDKKEREHVTLYMRNSGIFNVKNLSYSIDLSQKRWTVDQYEDYVTIKNVLEHFHPRNDFSWHDVLALEESHPQFFRTNKEVNRNIGVELSKGQKLWHRAKRIIPGGNMLLSKHPDQFLPGKWPVYFKRAKGCKVWDLDDRVYLDMCLMGVGTNILGYGHDEVDEAVFNIVQTGNLSTLNCYEEVLLAERLVDLHSWSKMARFARTGGEANAIAVRIARAASGKDNIAICGYHGWHDWYLASNLTDKNSLSNHLLPGLEACGVPTCLKDTIHPFNYNDFDALLNIVKTKNIGVIKMEVERNQPPKNDFLKRVRALASQHGIVLIFDECTSGFRGALGGLHKVYEVEPDIAVFGKTLGNGYAITAVIGREEVMEATSSSFISSTFWTERVGPAAALKTLEVMEKEKSYVTVTEIGKEVRKKCHALANKYELEICASGIPALLTYTFKSQNHLSYKTLITQEMLKEGFLASTSIYICTQHTPDVVKSYFEALEKVFALIKECEEGRDVESLLEVPVCDSGFKRMN